MNSSKTFVYMTEHYSDNDGAYDVVFLVNSLGKVIESRKIIGEQKFPEWYTTGTQAPQWLREWIEDGEHSKLAYIKGSRKVPEGFHHIVAILPSEWNGFFRTPSKAVIQKGEDTILISATTVMNYMLDSFGRMKYCL